MGAYLSQPVTEKISNDESNEYMDVGASSMQGWRISQEDAHNCLLNYDENTSFFAVYDGHGGAEVATYCAEKLPVFLKNLKAYGEKNFEEALKNAFLGFDATLLEDDIIEILKKLAGEKNPERDSEVEDEDEEEDLAKLCQEGALPLDQVLEKYKGCGATITAAAAKGSQVNKLRQDELGASGSGTSKPLSPFLRGRRPVPGTPDSPGPSGSSMPLLSKRNVNSSGDDNIDSNCKTPSSSSSLTTQSSPDADSTKANNDASDMIVSSSSGIKVAENLTEEKVEHVECEKMSIVENNGNVESSSPDSSCISRSLKGEGDPPITNNVPHQNGSTSSCQEKEVSSVSSSLTSSTTSKVPQKHENGEISTIPPMSSSSVCVTSTCVGATVTTEQKSISTESGSDVEVARNKAGGTSNLNANASLNLTDEQKNSKIPLEWLKTTVEEDTSSSEDDTDFHPEDNSSTEDGEENCEVYDGNTKEKNDDKEKEDTSSSEDDTDFHAEDSSSTEDGPGNCEIYDEETEEENDDEETEEDDDTFMGSGFPTDMIEEPGKDSGCTAVVALLHGRDLYVANAGDSRCIVCRKGEAIEMSLDHKPEDDEESARIMKAGGKVTIDGRVNGGLNLSRAIGDHAYKMNKKLSAEEQMISALPDVRKLVISPDDEFMVLACDGIWNYMSSEEVAEFVKKRLDEGREKISTICEELFNTCLAPSTMGDGTGCDNMTAVIIRFKPKILELDSHITEETTVIPVAVVSSKRRCSSPTTSQNNSIEDEEGRENMNKRLKTDDNEDCATTNNKMECSEVANIGQLQNEDGKMENECAQEKKQQCDSINMECRDPQSTTT